MTAVTGDAPLQVSALRMGAGERDRTADLPFTRRPLCQLSYTGGDVLMLAETQARLRPGADGCLR